MAGEECTEAHCCLLGHSASIDKLMSSVSGTKVFILHAELLSLVLTLGTWQTRIYKCKEDKGTQVMCVSSKMCFDSIAISYLSVAS